MKKLFPLALVAALAFPLCAQSTGVDPENDELTIEEDNGLAVEVSEPRARAAQWPAFLAIWDIPETPDLVGLRITVPWSTKQENVTGVDLGLWGRSMYFEGIQVNLLRNDVKDSCSGFQCGIYNSVARGDLFGIQLGGWNEAGSYEGFQVGLVNVAGDAKGVQFGLINRCETMYGFQIGLVNVIRDAEIKFFPVVNIGF